LTGSFTDPLIGELFTAIEQALAGKTYITPLVTKGVPLSSAKP
jgi:hypothetical protein